MNETNKTNCTTTNGRSYNESSVSACASSNTVKHLKTISKINQLPLFPVASTKQPIHTGIPMHAITPNNKKLKDASESLPIDLNVDGTEKPHHDSFVRRKICFFFPDKLSLFECLMHCLCLLSAVVDSSHFFIYLVLCNWIRVNVFFYQVFPLRERYFYIHFRTLHCWLLTSCISCIEQQTNWIMCIHRKCVWEMHARKSSGDHCSRLSGECNLHCAVCLCIFVNIHPQKMITIHFLLLFLLRFAQHQLGWFNFSIYLFVLVCLLLVRFVCSRDASMPAQSNQTHFIFATNDRIVAEQKDQQQNHHQTAIMAFAHHQPSKMNEWNTQQYIYRNVNA